MENPFEKAAGDAVEKTNNQTTKDEQKLNVPTLDTVKNLLPQAADKEALDKLIALVKEDTDRNTKVAALIKDVRSVESVLMKTLQALK